MADLNEKYEMLVDFFEEHGSGNPRALVERNIETLVNKGKTKKEAIVVLYQKYEKDILKIYDKHQERLAQARIRAKEGKRRKPQPVRKPQVIEEETPTLPAPSAGTPARPLAPKRRTSWLGTCFYFMGAVIVVLSLFSFYTTPWNSVEPTTRALYTLNLLVFFSVGATEIAVGWLIGKHYK